MKSFNKTLLYLLLVLSFTVTGCKKYLEEKPDKKLNIPDSLTDLQSLLDYYVEMNQRDASAGEISADDYYLTAADFNSLADEKHRRLYTWEKDFLFSTQNSNWGQCYKTVYVSNTVLHEIAKINRPTPAVVWDDVLGQAYFFRAKSYLQLALIWSLAYDENTAGTDMGVPLRLDPDFNELSVRSSVRQTYEQVVADLKAAVYALPVTSIHAYRPSRPAAYALLARTYLAMREYTLAGKYADSCLQLRSDLMNYNPPVSATAANPFTAYQFALNPEIIFDSRISSLPAILAPSRAKIDSNLMLMYSSNDLRKTVLFKNNGNGTFGYKGSYAGSALFTGLSVNEMYLIRAECYARAGNTAAALADLNTLLVKRWRVNTFIFYTAATPEEALRLILRERRKELVMRGLRWMDIKRLNKEGYNITLKRLVNGQSYILPPNDLRYALAIPEDVIDRTGMPQNPR
jgi:tetratricopeptide (TPR) repeat protein